jgi:hypothetical protein
MATAASALRRASVLIVSFSPVGSRALPARERAARIYLRPRRTSPIIPLRSVST